MQVYYKDTRIISTYVTLSYIHFPPNLSEHCNLQLVTIVETLCKLWENSYSGRSKWQHVRRGHQCCSHFRFSTRSTAPRPRAPRDISISHLPLRCACATSACLHANYCIISHYTRSKSPRVFLLSLPIKHRVFSHITSVSSYLLLYYTYVGTSYHGTRNCYWGILFIVHISRCFTAMTFNYFLWQYLLIIM